MSKLNNEQLANKIDWEGGIIAAIEWGIHAGDIEDPEVASLWAEIEVGYSLLYPAFSRLNELLELP